MGFSPACTGSTTTPRSRASASCTSCWTWSGSIGSRSRPASIRTLRASPLSSTCGREPTSPNARSTTCSEWCSRAMTTCDGSSCRRTTKASRSAATSRSEASRCCSPTTKSRATGSRCDRDTGSPKMTLSEDYRRREESVTLSAEPAGEGETHELLTLSIGPHHPATHGVLRLLATLEGELVRDVTPIVGYVHTGIEKTAEDKAYWKVIPVVERMDYLAYYFNAMAFCGAVETLLGVEVPPRAQYLRVIHLELNRIMSHLVWLGTSALDLGAISMFWYCFRERETILDLFEMSSGQRMHTRYIQVGGVFEDIPPGFEQKLRGFCRDMPNRADQYADMPAKNEIGIERLRGTGMVDQETLLQLGVTGPL